MSGPGGAPRTLAAWLLAGCLAVLACTSPSPSPQPTVPGPTSTAGASPTPATASPTPAGGTAAPPSASPSPTIEPPPTASPSPATIDTPWGELRVARTLPYATAGECGARVTVCQQFVDVYAPLGAGPWPVAVMIHGRPRAPRDMAPLAQLTAARGAVVFNADYRGVRPVGPGWPEAPEDIACAMRYARATAHLYGGDPTTLVLVGHSFGGYLGPLIALAGDEFDGACLYPAVEVSALPTGFVGISGNYIVEREPVWDRWYRGTPAEQPAAWRMGDFRTHLGGNPTLRVRIIHERGDPIIPPRQPRRFQRALVDAGYDSELLIIGGNRHFALLDPNDNGRRVVPFILQLLGIEP